jgi:broad specificity phosphatase PhoE
MEIGLQRLVMVRHGESHDDKRREDQRRGKIINSIKPPEQIDITDRGLHQSRLAGLWIKEHIIKRYGLPGFDGYYVSPAPRSKSSAAALGLPGANWQEEPLLNERNRGKVRGLSPEQHQQLYPESFDQMKSDPLHWVPPGGIAIIPDMVGQANQFFHKVRELRTVVLVGHRDWIWPAQMILEHLSEAELLAVNTDEIHNAQIIDYVAINPKTGKTTPALSWKRSVDPTSAISAKNWTWQALDL